MVIYDPISEALDLTPMPQFFYTKIFIPSESFIGFSAFGGKHHTEESKAAISAAHKGKTLSEEHILKIKNAKIGTSHSKQAKEKMKVAKLGKKQTPEHIAAAAAARVGKKKSPYVLKTYILCEHCNKNMNPGNYKSHIKAMKAQCD
jgi:hypothetical protein